MSSGLLIKPCQLVVERELFKIYKHILFSFSSTSFFSTDGKMDVVHHYDRDVSIEYGADWC